MSVKSGQVQSASESFVCGIADEDGGNAVTIGLKDLPQSVASSLRQDLREKRREFLVLEQIALTTATGQSRTVACTVPLSPAGTAVLFAAVKRTQDAMPLGTKLTTASSTSVRRTTVDKSSPQIVLRTKAAELILARLPRAHETYSPATATPASAVTQAFHASALVAASPNRLAEQALPRLPNILQPSQALTLSTDPPLLTPVVISAKAGVFIFDFTAVLGRLRSAQFGVIEMVAEVPISAEECALREALVSAENSAEEVAFRLFSLNDDMKALDDREDAVLATAMCECSAGATTLCLDFWIEAQELLNLGAVIGYGDGRKSDPNALLAKSRVHIHIGKTASDAHKTFNSTSISLNGGQDTIVLTHSHVAGETWNRQQVNDTTVFLAWNFKNSACRLASSALGASWGEVPELLCPGITGEGTFVFRSDGTPVSWHVLRDAFPSIGVHKKLITNGSCAGFLQLQEDRTKKSGRAPSRFDLFPFGRTDVVKGGNDPCLPQ